MTLKFVIDYMKMSSSIRWAFDWKGWNPSEADFTYAISCIQIEEKNRLDKFVFRKDVRASLIGRLMMRKFVNEYANIPYNEIVFERDDNNKPTLKNSLSISFNVSHQGDYTVLAGETKNIMLGIDVMKLEYTGGKQLSEFFRIMRRNFSVSEWKEIEGGPCTSEKEQIDMFCRHWALKESFVKALGIGVTTDLQTIDFRTKSKLARDTVVTDTLLFKDGIKQDWLFEETLIDSEHCVAVALEQNEEATQTEPNVFKIIDYEELITHALPLFPKDFEYTAAYFKKSESP